jgi:general nucleoside transport system ATP-binding protein
MGTAIELGGIVKRFPGVIANDGVDLNVEAGTIHALIGENGAGKSTVMKILYGAQSPDEGTVRVNGAEVHFKSPRDAIKLGIGMVFQHFMLAENLTVWENVVLGAEPGDGVRLDERKAVSMLRSLSDKNGLDVDPLAYVSDLGVGERQRVEILKVLYRGARIIILDEPTAVLVPQEVDELFVSLRELANGGATIIFISHKLDEVLAIADDITVLRAGKTVGTAKPSEITAHDLAEMMVGSELPTPAPRTTPISDDVVLAVDSLTVAAETAGGRPRLSNVSLSVRRGEIVGIAGVEGNGQSELLEALVGTLSPSSGTITLEGRSMAELSTRDRRAQGLAYIAEDRQRDSLLMFAPLWENAMLGYQATDTFRNGIWVDRAAARQRTAEIIAQYDVRTPGVDTTAVALSGGNQQKLIVGREMTSKPDVLVAAHPTRGIDVGAQADIWENLRIARDSGLAVLLVSADLEELIGLSDTLLDSIRAPSPSPNLVST